MPTQNKLSRRDFLQVAGATLGVSVLACSGLGVLATRAPEITLMENQYKGANDMRKVLVAYASKAGSTGEVAEAIGQVLNAKGITVDVRQVKKVKDVSGYQAFVIGSAIRMGRWLPEATKFLEVHKNELSQSPTAFFTVCLTLAEDNEKNRSEVKGYMQSVRAILEPVSLGLFGGKLDLGKLSFIERFIMANLIKAREGDFRDWDAIRGWAGELATQLSA